VNRRPTIAAHPLLGRAEVHEAGVDQRLDVARRFQLLHRRAPTSLVHAEQPLLAEHGHQALDEQRVAAGAVDDVFPHTGRGCHVAEEMAHELLRLVAAEGRQLNGDRVHLSAGPARPRIQQLQAGRAQQQ
jgi:hypothetical protein